MVVSKLMEKTDCPILPYDPAEFPRETQRHYISANEEEIRSMLETIRMASPKELFSHIPDELMFADNAGLPDELEYMEAAKKLLLLSEKTNLRNSFIGDLLPVWKTHPIVDFVSKLRPLTTSYTPYQPERSQGTLVTHWIFQCALSTLTGFEAINTSLYDRSAALFEAISCAIRTSSRGSKVLLASTLFDEDVEVLKTLARETKIEFTFARLSAKGGLIDYSNLEGTPTNGTEEFAAFVFPQVNKFGLLEDVDLLTDFAHARGMRSIACFWPLVASSLPLTSGRKGLTSLQERLSTLLFHLPSVGRASVCSDVVSQKNESATYGQHLGGTSGKQRI
jgi:glycine dehydrogenase